MSGVSYDAITMKERRLSSLSSHSGQLSKDFYDNYEESGAVSLSCFASDSCESEDFLGFPGTESEVDKQVRVVNLISKRESEMTGLDLERRDIIDGIEFLSFESKEGQTLYTRLQEELTAKASQSDDGLEIADDGSNSDISSSHVIMPTKTNDITRIKGWRNKNFFVSVNSCDDSVSSLRNGDDGFGDDDLEIKSIRDESSEDTKSVDCVGSSTALRYRFGEPCSVAESSDMFSQLPFKNSCFNSIESDVVEDSNAVDNAEESGFNFRKSLKKNIGLPSHTSCRSSCTSTSTSSVDELLSSAQEDVESIFTPEQNMHSVKPTIKPLDTISLKQTNMGVKSVYKSVNKLKFLESLENKVKVPVDDKTDNAQSAVVTNNSAEPKVIWRVPREKLISGNIYDIEASMTGNDFNRLKSELISPYHRETNKCELVEGNQNFKTDTSSIKEHGSNQDTFCEDPFQSRNLEEFATGFGELHIDFVIPKLDASDTVTHEEIEFPKEKTPVTPRVQKEKPKGFIKAKTLAEKRRLIEEMNSRGKRKPKLSYKLRNNKDCSINSAENTKNNKTKKKNNVNKDNPNVKFKKHQPVNFDQQGVITYGREKPLLSVLTKNQLSLNNKLLHSRKETLSSNKVGMILNVGFKRPLYKEAADNIKMISDENCTLSQEFVGFAVSAVQKSVKGPFNVTRFLMPVAEEYLKELKLTPKELKLTPKSLKTVNKNHQLTIDQLAHNLEKVTSDSKMAIIEEKLFCEPPSVESTKVIETLVDDIVNCVERKEYFDELQYMYDPDVPTPAEETLITDEQKLKINEKKKKSKLQRQIEQLGCTFIAVQSDKCCEENSKPLANEMCSKDCCKLGCVCYVQQRTDEHCRKSACMFLCQCSSSSKKQGCEVKNKVWLNPDVLRIQSSTQSKLAKVEKEYHQTVIMSEDQKTIMIENKHKKRERKVPSKFKDALWLDDTNENYQLICNNGPSSRNSLTDHGLLLNPKVVSTSPAILPLDSFLKSPSKVSKECFVSIEKSYAVQKIANETSSSPRTPGNKNKAHHVLSKSFKQKSKNVARKKTGPSAFHSFDVKNNCSRTYGVLEDYSLRNLHSMLPLKHMMTYPAASHRCEIQGLNILPQVQNGKDPVIIKEDLLFEMYPNDEIQKDEMVCLEKEQNDEGCHLAIGFVCTLPKEVFENQVHIDFEEIGDNLQSALPESAAESNGKETITDHAYPADITGSRGMNKKIVSASLPTSKTDHKWWVVELDREKFSSLNVCSDKQTLLFDIIRKANFMAEYSKNTIKIPLNKPFNNEAGKFGAYALPGHKHLIFFGPYQLCENHGVTAVKHDKNKSISVPFTTEINKCGGLQSLGLFQSVNEENNKNDALDKFVKADWWYSTRRKTIVDRNADDNVKKVIETKISKSLDDEKLEHIDEHEKDTNLSQQRIQTEVCLDNESSNSSIGDKDCFEGTSIVMNELPLLQNEISHNDSDCTIEEYSVKSDNFGSNKSLNVVHDTDSDVSQELDICTNSSDSNDFFGVDSKVQAFISEPCELKKKIINQKKKSISKKPITSSREQIKNSKRKIGERSLEKTQGGFQHNAKILRLTEEIAGLNNDIGLAKININDRNICKLKGLQEVNDCQNLSIDFEDDSSSCSDAEFYEEIGLGLENYTQTLEKLSSHHVSTGTNKTHRVIHKPPARSRKSKEDDKSGSLNISHLMLKEPCKGPCPDMALFCQTEGVGYVPVLESDHKMIVIKDPERDNMVHEFRDRRHAANWLNRLFAKRFTMKTAKKMQWRLLKGESLIRRLQPLNREIFQFPPKQVEVTQTGLESPMYVKQVLRNQLERERRMELTKLVNELRQIVIPPEKRPDEGTRVAYITVLKYTKRMIDLQRQIALELSATSLELTRKKSESSCAIKKILLGIDDDNDKRQAVELCREVKSNLPNKKEELSTYITNMEKLEMRRLVQNSCPKAKFKIFRKPTSLADSSQVSKNCTPHPVPSEVSTCSNSMESSIPSTSQEVVSCRIAGPRKRKPASTRHQATKRWKSHNPAIPSVIDLVNEESDDDDVIEIPSDESDQDVIWIGDKDDDDVTVLSSTRPLLPRPWRKAGRRAVKRRLKRLIPNNKRVNLRLRRPVRVAQVPAVEPEHVILDSEEESESIVEKGASSDGFTPLFASSRVNVNIGDIISSPSSFRTSSQPLEPKSSKVYKTPEQKKDVQINQNLRCILPKPPIVKENSYPQSASNNKVLECSTLTLVGKVNPGDYPVRGKSILVKLPPSVPFTAASLLSSSRENTVTLHHPLSELSETRTVQQLRQIMPPQTTSQMRAQSILIRTPQQPSVPAGQSRLNTLTLYHASEEKCETRTMPLLQPAVKILKPMDTCESNLRILLPKRS